MHNYNTVAMETMPCSYWHYSQPISATYNVQYQLDSLQQMLLKRRQFSRLKMHSTVRNDDAKSAAT